MKKNEEYFTHAYNGRGEGTGTSVAYEATLGGIVAALRVKAATGRTRWLADAGEAIVRREERDGNVALAAAARAITKALEKECHASARAYALAELIREFGPEDGPIVFRAHIEFALDVSACLVRALSKDRALRFVMKRYLYSSPGGRRGWNWACGPDGRARKIFGNMTWPRVEATIKVARLLDPSL